MDTIIIGLKAIEIRINNLKIICKSIEDQIPEKIKNSKKQLKKNQEIFLYAWYKEEIPYKTFEKGSMHEKIYLKSMERIRK